MKKQKSTDIRTHTLSGSQEMNAERDAEGKPRRPSQSKAEEKQLWGSHQPISSKVRPLIQTSESKEGALREFV